MNYLALLTDNQLFSPKMLQVIYVSWLWKATVKLHMTTQVLFTGRV